MDLIPRKEAGTGARRLTMWVLVHGRSLAHHRPVRRPRRLPRWFCFGVPCLNRGLKTAQEAKPVERPGKVSSYE